MSDIGTEFKEKHEAWKERQLITCHTLAELHELYRKWWYIEEEDLDFIDVGLACTLDREIPGDPAWLYLIAPSGGLKTELIRCLSSYKKAYTLDTLTTATFISGLTQKNKETGKLEPVAGLLKSMDGHCVMIKDFTTILKTSDDNRNEIYGQLRSIYDGYFEKGVGTLPEPIRVRASIGLVVGVTPVIDKYTLMASTLGERFLKIRSNPDRRKATTKAIANEGNEVNMRDELSIGTTSFFESRNFDYTPTFTEDQIENLINMGMYVGIMRANVWKTWESGRVVDMDIMGSEVPTRITKQLKHLVKLLCIIRGKDSATDAEMRTAARVAMDTCDPKNQALVSRHIELYGKNEPAHVDDIGAATKGVSRSTARNNITILEALGAVQYVESGIYVFTPSFGNYIESIFEKYIDKEGTPSPPEGYQEMPEKGLLDLTKKEVIRKIYSHIFDKGETKEGDIILDHDVELDELRTYLNVLKNDNMIFSPRPGVWKPK